MNPGKIIKKATINDQEFLFRLPKQSDLHQLRDYINDLSQERTFIRFQGEQVTLEEEQEYLDKMLNSIREDKILSILAIHQKQIVGSTDIRLLNKTEVHLGVFGIVIKKSFRNQGLGTYLMNLAIEQSQHLLPDLEILKLGVYANNKRAIHVYQKLGFKQYGLLPEGIKLENSYQDRILMYRKVKKRKK